MKCRVRSKSLHGANTLRIVYKHTTKSQEQIHYMDIFALKEPWEATFIKKQKILGRLTVFPSCQGLGVYWGKLHTALSCHPRSCVTDSRRGLPAYCKTFSRVGSCCWGSLVLCARKVAAGHISLLPTAWGNTWPDP